MAATWTQVSQMTIKELADFSRGLALMVGASPDAAKLRAALHEALSAECTQCAIRLSGTDILTFASDEPTSDPRIERLRTGYCARNGCESHFYTVTCAPHWQINWPSLIGPRGETSPDEKAEIERAVAKATTTALRRRSILRAALAITALLVVILLRQLYVGGSIPLLRQPENFKVDRGVAADGR